MCFLIYIHLLISISIVTDLINRIVQVLKKDLERLAVSVQDAGLMELVEL